MIFCLSVCFYPHLRACLLILESGEGMERNVDVREKHHHQLPLIHTLTGTEPTI